MLEATPSRLLAIALVMLSLETGDVAAADTGPVHPLGTPFHADYHGNRI